MLDNELLYICSDNEEYQSAITKSKSILDTMIEHIATFVYEEKASIYTRNEFSYFYTPNDKKRICDFAVGLEKSVYDQNSDLMHIKDDRGFGLGSESFSKKALKAFVSLSDLDDIINNKFVRSTPRITFLTSHDLIFEVDIDKAYNSNVLRDRYKELIVKKEKLNLLSEEFIDEKQKCLKRRRT